MKKKLRTVIPIILITQSHLNIFGIFMNFKNLMIQTRDTLKPGPNLDLT